MRPAVIMSALTVYREFQMDKPLIHFVHGKESGPWGTKIRLLADIAREMGYDVESLDYSHTFDSAERVQMLVASCKQRPPRLLAGSSMGGWVALDASAELKAMAGQCLKGLFLMAPAVDIPGYPPYRVGLEGDAIDIVHGWHDPLIPYTNAIAFAHEHHATLHLVEDMHRLQNRLPQLGQYFRDFLIRMG